ncbi:MAG: transcription elongation factor GreA [Candidatus Binatia bacterium]|nr:transcription elongation factor GreA [Candidatus Binatia bacterium]
MPNELPIIEKLKKELADLQYELTRKLPKELQEAASHGDLSENAEYDAAKHRQEYVRARIAQLQSRISQLSLYNLNSVPRDVVGYGSRVTLEDVEDGSRSVFEIVMPEEVNPAAGLISLSSPLGQALLHKKVGDEVEVKTPRGERTYTIVELVTLHDRESL